MLASFASWFFFSYLLDKEGFVYFEQCFVLVGLPSFFCVFTLEEARQRTLVLHSEVFNDP